MKAHSRRNAILAMLAGSLSIAALPRRAPAQNHQVIIKGFTFTPPELTIIVGESVTFTNEDGAPHSATALDGAFDTGRLARGMSATLTFMTKGDQAYACHYHPSMKGVIHVT